MSDEPHVAKANGQTWACAVWVLFLLSVFLFPLLGEIVAAIIAYVMRPRLAATFSGSHMTYAIMTFWIIFIPIVVLSFIIAYAFFYDGNPEDANVFLFVAASLILEYSWFFVVLLLWYFYRCVKGLVLAIMGRAIRNPRSLI